MSFHHSIEYRPRESVVHDRRVPLRTDYAVVRRWFVLGKENDFHRLVADGRHVEKLVQSV